MLGRRTRKATLVVHLVSAGAWIGIDVVVAVLVFVGWFADDPARRGTAYQALGWFVLWPMFTAGLVCLASGVLLGLGSQWGLLRYWWVAVKLALNLVLTSLVLVLLRPMMPGAVEHGQAIAAGRPSDFDAAKLFFPPLVSLTALTLATLLAVFKPWGRIRRRDVAPREVASRRSPA
jgi:hypothetical protein